MTTKHNHLKLQNKPAVKHQELFSGIKKFFYKNPPNTIAQSLWDVAGFAMGNKDMDNRSHVDRANIIYFLRDLEMLIQNNLQIYRLEKGLKSTNDD